MLLCCVLRRSVVMVDEAHERSVATDMLLGLLRKVQQRRPDLRLVISSATLEADTLKRFYGSGGGPAVGVGSGAAGAAPDRTPAVLSIEGRMYPVQVRRGGPWTVTGPASGGGYRCLSVVEVSGSQGQDVRA